MDRNIVILMVVLLILIVRGESRVSLIRPLLKLAKTGDSKHIVTQTAPSPSPAPSLVANSSRDGGGEKAGVPPAPTVEERNVSVTDERCVISSSEWCRDSKNMTACLPYAGSGPQGSYIVIQNDEGNSLEVKLTIFPLNSTLEAIELEKHQAKKVQINNSATVWRNSVNCGKCWQWGLCNSSGISGPSRQLHRARSFWAHLCRPHTRCLPTGIDCSDHRRSMAWGKWGRQGRHLDGVPYRELEMGLPESFSAANVETAAGWDQDWDDEWDEDNVVKSPNGQRLRNGHKNGLASMFSNSDEWGNESNDWDN